MRAASGMGSAAGRREALLLLLLRLPLAPLRTNGQARARESGRGNGEMMATELGMAEDGALLKNHSSASFMMFVGHPRCNVCFHVDAICSFERVQPSASLTMLGELRYASGSRVMALSCPSHWVRAATACRGVISQPLMVLGVLMDLCLLLAHVSDSSACWLAVPSVYNVKHHA